MRNRPTPQRGGNPITPDGEGLLYPVAVGAEAKRRQPKATMGRFREIRMRGWSKCSIPRT